MHILVVGLGSMGKRRARILAGLRGQSPAFGALRLFCVDANADRLAQAGEFGAEGGFATLAEALVAGRYDAAFVCSPPLTHAPVISALLDAGVPVFSEINLVPDGYPELMEKARAKGVLLFLSSTMLYRAETNYIAGAVRQFSAAGGQPVRYIYHVGQYLPDWHPWENYRDFFVGNPRTGGVREILAIELPWLVSAFGDVADVAASSASISGLGLPYDDSVSIVLRHKSGAEGFFAADVATPKAVRNLEVYSGGLQLFWEGNPQSLCRYDAQEKAKVPVDTYEHVSHDARYSDNIVENAYVDEILNFFDALAGRAAPKWSFAQDLPVLELIDRAYSAKGEQR